MKSVGSYEAKTHLPRLLDEVEKGERITITKHGRPVAILVPPGATRDVDVEVVLTQMRAFRKAHPLNGVSIRDLIDEGRP
ncbi:MAG TPA: type II toxin-antitoxin system prevent-host-death family antitoxin [Candidatus Limnocylindrales bacterium]